MAARPDPRRVLFVHEIYSTYGGAERYLEVLGGGLRSRGLDVEALVFGVDADMGALAADRLRGWVNRVDGLPHRFAPRAMSSSLRRLRPDVVHWNFADPFSFRGASWLFGPWGRPQVATDHLPMHRCGPHWEVTRRLANRRLSALIVVSQAAEDAARRHWRRPPPVSVVPNGVVAGRSSIRSRPASGEAIRMAFVGRLEEQKDPTFVLLVLRRLLATGHAATLCVVGDGSLRQQMQDAAADLGDLVAFLGEQASPWEHTQSAHVLLVPSRYEGGFPLVAREALVSGLPVVLSDIPTHHEPGHPGAVVAPLGDPDRWARAVLGQVDRLPASSAEALSGADSGSFDRMVNQTLDVYRSALAPKGTRPATEGQVIRA